MAGSIWKGSISFGLLNIPITVQKAEEGHELSFKMLDEKDLSPIKFKKTSATDGKEVPWPRIVKGYEYDSGQYVLVTKDDFKAANPKASQTIDIQDFVDLKEVDTMFFEKPYYLVPQKSGIKGYFLLAEALKKTNKVAIAKVVMRTKMHLVCIMAKANYLVMEIMRFSHEVLSLDEVDYLKSIEKPKFDPKEIKMAQELIEGMTAKWNPEQYKDTYNDDLMGIINLKISKGETKEIDYGDLIKEDSDLGKGKVVDIMPLLKKSLEEKRKARERSGSQIHKKKTKTSRRGTA